MVYTALEPYIVAESLLLQFWTTQRQLQTIVRILHSYDLHRYEQAITSYCV